VKISDHLMNSYKKMLY